MKFKPLLGTDLSGHVGGVVASHNTYGPYFRQRVKPVNKKTPAMQAQRTAIASVAQSWRSLDPTVQAAWSAASIVKTSRKGDKITLTGSAAYQYCNTLRARIGLPLVGNPPTGSSDATVTNPSVNLTAANAASITFASDAWNAAGGGIIISGALLTSSGRTYSTPSLAIATLPDPGTSPIAVLLPFAIPIGARIRFLFHAAAPDGRLSTYTTTDVTNASFAPPTTGPVNVLSVTAYTSSQAVWLFDRPVSSLVPALLTINGVAGTTAADPVTPEAWIISYAAAPTGGQPWAITNAGATTPISAAPQSGSVHP